VTPAADGATVSTDPEVYFNYSCRTGLCVLAASLALLIGAVALQNAQQRALQLLGTFYYVGSIVFGGGPVVVPLLYNYVVTTGWIASSDFLLGLAIINATPGVH
jgi:Chromate transporter